MKSTARITLIISLLLGSSLLGLAPQANATTVSYYNDCGSRSVVKPTGITEYCADAGSGVISIKWSTWSTTKATATGTFYINGCDPSCADGKVYKTKVAVTLSGLAKLHGKSYLMHVLVVPVGGKKFVWPPKMKPVPSKVTWTTNFWRT